MNKFVQYFNIVKCHKSPIARQINEIMIDKSITWGYFDGVCQNNIIGTGGPLYLPLRITITDSKPIWEMGQIFG